MSPHPANPLNDDSDMRPIGERLREAREHARLSRRELSERTGVAERQIYAYERGENEPPWSAVVTISRVLRLSLDSLAGRRPEEVEPDAMRALEDLEEAYQRLARASRLSRCA